MAVIRDVRKAAMDYLARREHTRLELNRKLQGKGFAADDIEKVLLDLSREGLQSDERFTEAFISSRLQRGSGPIKIAMELQQRGVVEELISLYLDERDSQWQTVAAKVREKRFGRLPPTDFKERARQMRFLQYRGFTMAQIQQAMGGEDAE